MISSPTDKKPRARRGLLIQRAQQCCSVRCCPAGALTCAITSADEVVLLLLDAGADLEALERRSPRAFALLQQLLDR